MNIDTLTIGEAKQLAALFGSQQSGAPSLNGMIGSKVIVRTYAAGCWFGTLSEKAGSEVIIKDARRMWYWKAEQGISLSACAMYGVSSQSKIVEAMPSVWLDAIELIPCSEAAIKSIEGAKNVKAE